jgi:hypothetical protein
MTDLERLRAARDAALDAYDAAAIAAWDADSPPAIHAALNAAIAAYLAALAAQTKEQTDAE